MKNKVCIIDYGVGNNQSVINALDFLGYDFSISNKKKDIAKAGIYILPGVGAFAEGMRNLTQLGLIDFLKEQVIEKKKPILGICLGFQLFADFSQENGYHKGLGFVKGKVIRLKEKKDLRVPHVGWNEVKITKKDPLFSRVSDNSDFYFDHSYQLECDKKYLAGTCTYGKEVVCAAQKENIFGVQFHPEKSQNNGLKLLRSFFENIC